MDKHQKSLFDTTPEPWELDAAQDRLVVTVALPENPYGPFDYTVPEGLRELAEVGRRARVPLGRATDRWWVTSSGCPASTPRAPNWPASG